MDALLTKELSAYIRNPRIDVMVKEYRSKSALALGEYSLLRGGSGSQTGSGKLFLEGKTTLMDFIALGHGYTVKGDIRRLKLIRKGKTYVINVYSILRVQSSIQVKASYHSAFCKTERSFMSYVNWCSLNAVGIYK